MLPKRAAALSPEPAGDNAVLRLHETFTPCSLGAANMIPIWFATETKVLRFDARGTTGASTRNTELTGGRTSRN